MALPYVPFFSREGDAACLLLHASSLFQIDSRAGSLGGTEQEREEEGITRTKK